MSLFSRHRSSYAQAAGLSLPPAPAAPSPEQLQLVADNVPNLVSYVDTSGRYTFVNRAYERWFGGDRDAIVGRHIRDVIGEEAWLTIERYVSAALGGAAVHFEAKVPYRKSGTRWIDCTYTPDVDASGDVRGIVACVSDITERKQLEIQLLENATEQQDVAEALRASEARYRLLAEQLQAADQRKNEFLALLAHELRNPLAPIRNGLHLVRIAADPVARERGCAMMDRQLRHMVRLVDAHAWRHGRGAQRGARTRIGVHRAAADLPAKERGGFRDVGRTRAHDRPTRICPAGPRSRRGRQR